MANEEMVQELALNLDLALMELRSIDAVLARRPALADCPSRVEKIERSVSAAARLDGLLRRYGSHASECARLPQCTCGWSTILNQLRVTAKGGE